MLLMIYATSLSVIPAKSCKPIHALLPICLYVWICAWVHNFLAYVHDLIFTYCCACVCLYVSVTSNVYQMLPHTAYPSITLKVMFGSTTE